MDANWLNALVALASLLTLLISVLIGYLFRLSKELSDYKTHVAMYHATKDEMKDLSARLELQMQTGFNRIYDLLKNKRDAA